MTSEYEQLRLNNLAENKRVLAELGLNFDFNKLKVVHKPVKRKPKSDQAPAAKRARYDKSLENDENCGSLLSGTRRRSSRIQGKDAKSEDELKKEFDEGFEDDEDDDDKRKIKIIPNRPNVWGEIEGVDVGTVFETRLLCCAAGIHRPTVAGIHGNVEGAYSLALSGGYEDDIDMGEAFTYTGQGGRDLKGTKSNPKNLRTAPQSKDQTLTHGNLALSMNCQNKRPVRVIRGFKSKSQFAPLEGYRYDGLYTVERFWFAKGISGFGVYKFALKRCPDQAPPPWTFANEVGASTYSQDSGINSEKPLNSDKTNTENVEMKDEENDENDHSESSEVNNADGNDEVDDDDTRNEESSGENDRNVVYKDEEKKDVDQVGDDKENEDEKKDDTANDEIIRNEDENVCENDENTHDEVKDDKCDEKEVIRSEVDDGEKDETVENDVRNKEEINEEDCEMESVELNEGGEKVKNCGDEIEETNKENNDMLDENVKNEVGNSCNEVGVLNDLSNVNQ